MQTIQAGEPCTKPPNTVSPETCCEFPNFEKKSEVIEACAKKYSAEKVGMLADKTPGAIKRGSCLAECIYNGTGHGDLTVDMDPAKFMTEVEAKGLPEEWVPAIKSMADFCFAEGKKRMDDLEAGFKLPPLDPKDEVCHPKFGFALVCSAKEMLRHCPEKFFKPTPECKALQEHTKTCDLM